MTLAKYTAKRRNETQTLSVIVEPDDIHDIYFVFKNETTKAREIKDIEIYNRVVNEKMIQ